MRPENQYELTGPPRDCDRRIRSFYDYWLSIYPKAGLPGRQHFDPMDIPGLLPNIWLLDIFRDPQSFRLRFRVRLTGTRITEISGRDATGKWCHDIYDAFEETDGFRCISACAIKGRPQFRKGRVIANRDRVYIETERIYLPLASNGKDVDIMANMSMYLGRY